MSESDDKDTKEHDERLQRRLHLLKEQFEAGKIELAKGLKVIDSLRAVRAAPDGSIDLDTVDGLVRSLALAVEFAHEREEMKKAISLREIQNTYFSFLESNFGRFFEMMKERGLTPHDAGMAFSQDSSAVEDVNQFLPDFLGTVKEYWNNLGEIAHAHVEDMHSALKGIFGGDLFPAHSENIASKCGIYTDTLILPDPFLRTLYVFEVSPPEQRTYYFIKHALNLLKYKELACAEVEPPIVVVVPDYTALQKSEKEFVHELGRDDALVHAERVFGRPFESFEELMEYAQSMNTLDLIVPAIADSSRVLFDAEWEGSISEQIARAMKDEHSKMLKTNNPGVIVAAMAAGRLSVTNELLIKARRLSGTPIIDAATSWQYFAWKLEYDAERKEREEHLEDLHVLRGLQTLADNEMEWLGNVPPEALIEIRKQGALQEIRQIIGQEVENLVSANPANFHRTSDQVFDNIHAAFDQHKNRIKELRSKQWKFAGSDVGSWIVVGSLAITAAATGLPVWGLAAIAADQILDAPKLKNIPESIIELARESRELKHSPLGILFRYGGTR
jgi:hypothetical protein